MSGAEREALIRALPYARRLARAMTGSQERGDRLVTDALRDLLEGADSQEAIGETNARLALYRAVAHRACSAPAAAGNALNPVQRCLLLLTSLEELPVEQAAAAVGLDLETARSELGRAREHLRSSASTRVLIIEDEPIIAMDIQGLVEACGHQVVGIASTEEEAVAIAEAERPGLVLADINLGTGGDGTSAVARILRRHDMPVIFVTAYPERLLTGEAVEPAFVITKPFEPTTLAVATYQAVTREVHLS